MCVIIPEREYYISICALDLHEEKAEYIDYIGCANLFYPAGSGQHELANFNAADFGFDQLTVNHLIEITSNIPECQAKVYWAAVFAHILPSICWLGNSYLHHYPRSWLGYPIVVRVCHRLVLKWYYIASGEIAYDV